MMRKLRGVAVIVFTAVLALTFGCTKDEGSVGTTPTSNIVLKAVDVAPGDPLVYINIASGEASSFDQTPDWAPEPNPMAAVDGDMVTRWSSSYMEGEQWIAFDLGKPGVVSDVIVRWERAHATDYSVMVSLDGENWQEAAREKDAKGGSVESTFAPVKCRYVKILGRVRVNEDWGISIWEVEIYGPKGHNPAEKVTKNDYIARGDDEGKRKEAEALISKLAAPVVPVSQKAFQKGVVYTSWMADELGLPASDLMLAYIKESGFDTVSIMVPAYQEALDSKEIFTNDKTDGDTPTIESLKHAVDSCHKLGLRVMMKPHVDPRTDEARINIMASEEWFDSYENFVLRYAVFSQENGVELFSLGTELEATTFEAWTHRWDQLIEKVRGVYKGALTYSANWTEYKEVPFWDKMDFIGIDAYFPLTESNEPTVDELVAAWTARADDIESWLGEKGLTAKGVLLTEIGYPSADGANRQPWVAISNVEDQQEQADSLEAMFRVLVARPWFKGYYIWQYFPQDRWSPLGFTVKGKKAEEVIKKWIKKFE